MKQRGAHHETALLWQASFSLNKVQKGGGTVKEIYSDVIEFRGSHYDFGRMQGELLLETPIIENREKQWKIRRPRFQIHVRETKEVISRFAPQIWDELLGLQDALKWDMERVLKEFGGYRLEYVKSGCSIYTTSDYMIRNYDYHPKTYEGRYTVFQPEDRGYAIIGPSQRITGRMDGMNEQGLAIGYNFMHRKKPGDGFICHMIARLVLETCASVDEAVDLLKEIPHRHSFSYIVLDPSGVTYVVEATPRSVAVRTSQVCTNHFEILTDENRNHLEDSYKRLEVIEQKKHKATDAKKAYRMLNDTNGGVFSDKYKDWAGTIHTSAYFPKEKVAWFALGGDQEPVVFNFASWLEGDTMNTQRITGKVNTELPFVHMEKNVK